MHKFSDFAKETSLEGDKIGISSILNKEITVTKYRVMKSKHTDGDCLELQIELDGRKRVLFTGSSVLLSQAKEYESEMPFLTTIKKIDKYYSFT